MSLDADAEERRRERMSQELSPRSLRRTTLLLAAGGAISVANIYYCQPLLGDMGRSLGVGDAPMGLAAAMTQAGTALGMLVFVPLGDVFERRRLASWMCVASASAVALTSLAPTFAWLVAASFLVGMANNIPHLLLPFAAQIAPDDRRGKVVGTVVGGLLVGILVSRFFSGWLGALLGWRWVYRVATLVMLGLAVAIGRLLPASPPTLTLPFRALYASVAALVRDEAQLRASAASGALLFGAFSAFWTTLVFLLGTPPYHYGARAAGLFGLVAAASAGVAPLVGRAVDRRPPSAGVVFGALLTFGGWCALAVAAHRLAGLVAGVVILDVGVQSGHVANQARIYKAFPVARSRANTVYMVSYFVGGATGSILGAHAWSAYGWPGVCAVGMAFSALAGIVGR
jgi:predicted MFS family arabinose efflux permease